ncbi:TrmH family RNA methyltransferase [Hirschia litorea]|uniref:TrmH family RNA methyltransferase n=1 Tax=Hirschia litorea TaxID=1199156 RepID=A0ABW2IHC4_9PROT
MAHAPYEHITSTSNTSIKLLRGLDRKKNRTESGLFLAEGARLILDALKFGWKPRYILVGEDSVDRKEVQSILEQAEMAGARILTTGPRILTAVSRKENSQTIIAAFQQKLDRLEDFSSSGKSRYIALYQVRDPGNLGTILRTADAAGVKGVVLVGQCCDPFSVECVRATMGALFSTKIVSVSFEEFNEWRKKEHILMAAASVNGTIRHDQTDYSDKSVILMGNEQSGIPDDVEACCDTLIKIPMAGAADSLNLAQATAIMTYEVWKGSGYDGAK